MERRVAGSGRGSGGSVAAPHLLTARRTRCSRRKYPGGARARAAPSRVVQLDCPGSRRRRRGASAPKPQQKHRQEGAREGRWRRVHSPRSGVSLSGVTCASRGSLDLDLGTACPLGTCARHGVGQQLNTRTHDTRHTVTRMRAHEAGTTREARRRGAARPFLPAAG